MTEFNTLHAAVNAMTAATARRQGIWTLGQLRAALSALPPEMPVVMQNGGSPGSLDSYRGYYERLAISTDTEKVTAADVIARLDAADGDSFHGYKGGEFWMDSGTYLHAAEYGDCGEAIVGLRVDLDVAVIETAEEEW